MASRNSDPFKYFRIEASQLLDKLTSGCLALKEGRYEEGEIRELNKAANSLKGAARIVGLFDIGDAANSLEHAFKQLQELGASPSANDLTDLLRQVDDVKQTVAAALAESEGVSMPAREHGPRADLGSSRAGRIRVLVVDDSLTARNWICMLIQSHPDMEVAEEASDGNQAIALTEQLRPDVIVMDMAMPLVNGVEATRRIMADFPTPIVILSGAQDASCHDDVVETLRAGAMEAVEKPNRESDVPLWTRHFLNTVRTLSHVKVTNHRDGRLPSQKSRGRARILFNLSLCVGLILSILAFVLVRNWERQRIHATFQRAAENRVSAIGRGIDLSLNELEALTAFFDGSKSVERDEFLAFVEPFLSHNPEVQALEWIPRVPHARRTEFENAARQDGFPDYQITDRKAQGHMVRAAQREEYFPVSYVQPYEGNESALGFDVASDPAKLEALTKSRDTGETSTTGRVMNAGWNV